MKGPLPVLSLSLGLVLFLQSHMTVSAQFTSEEVCGARFDLTLLIDSSGSIRDANPKSNATGEPFTADNDNWSLILMFLTQLVDLLYITDSETEGVRVAGVSFSDKAAIEFFFHTNNSSLKEDILDTRYQGGHTNISGALRRMTHEIFAQKDRTDFLGKKGTTDRKNIRDVALVITDGFSNKDEDRTISDAQIAKDQDITLFVIGVTNKIDENEITAISSEPQVQNKTYWLLPNFQALEPVVQNIASQICTQVNLTDAREMTTTLVPIIESGTTSTAATITTTAAATTTTTNSPAALSTPQSPTTTQETAPTGASVAPASSLISNENLIIGVGVLAGLLFLLLLILLILCCCFKSTPCCAGFCGCCPCCAGDNKPLCNTELFCCCGSILCCFCCAQWLLCCCCCLCWTHQHHTGKVSPSESVIAIIHQKDQSTNTSRISVKPPPVMPAPVEPPPPATKTIEVCGRCMKEMPQCICSSQKYVVVPPPVMQPVYMPQPQPQPIVAPLPTPHLPPPLPCPTCYGQYSSNHHQHCGCHDSYCETCAHQWNSGHQSAAIDSNQVHLKYHQKKSASTKRKTVEDHSQSDTDADIHRMSQQYEKVLQRSNEREERKRSDVNSSKKYTRHFSHRESDLHDSCATRIFLVSDHEQKRSTGTPGSEDKAGASDRSYVYLPTDCPVKMSQEMSETLRQDYGRATAGK